MSSCSRPTLVIGYGNPLRRDDGLGWHVAQQVAGERFSNDVTVIAVHQLTPELAELTSQAGLVVFVDAQAGDNPGHIECCEVTPASEIGAAFSHEVGPDALLALAGALYGARPSALVLTVDGADFGYGIGLSDAVRAAVPAVLRRLRTLIAGARTYA
jgi:hydrogenase maturation protease